MAVRETFKAGGYKACLEKFYYIRDKWAKVHLIKLNSSQKDMIDQAEKQLREDGRVRILVLKARQIGFSTAIQGIEVMNKFLVANNFALVLSHEGKSAKYLYEMGRMAICDMWPLGQIKPIRNRMDGMVLDAPVSSTVEVATAKNAGAGRSRTIQFLHASECAFYEGASTMMLGMLQSVPDRGSFVFMETTANGIGNWFHRQWEDAQSGQSSYKALFYPWQDHLEYRSEFTSDIAREAFRRSYTQEEKDIVEKYKLIPEQIKWRRMTIVDKCEGDVVMFRQEYPMTEDEAFIVSGRPVFNPDNMKKILDRARSRQPLGRGWLKV
jgi:hypothetical protein